MIIHPLNNKTDNFLKKKIFNRKKILKEKNLEKKVGISCIRSRCRIRIRYFTERSRGFGSGSISKLNGSETLFL